MVEKDRSVTINFYNDEMKPVAATTQNVTAIADAKSGKAYVHVWHSSPAAQELTVTAGTPITVRAWVRPTAEATAKK